MKVLHVIASLDPGGAETVVAALARSQRSQGAEVRAHLLEGVNSDRSRDLVKQLQDAGVEVSGKEFRKIATVANLLRLTALVRTWRPEILHAHLESAEIACLAARMLRPFGSIKCVRSLQSTKFCYRGGPLRRQIIWILDRGFEFSVACAEPVADGYRALRAGQVRTKLIVIPNGCEVMQHDPTPAQKQQARGELDIAPEAFAVAHLGSFRWGSLQTAPKAHDTLLKAFAEAFADDVNAVLLLVGGGALREAAEQLARRLGIRQRVRFLGTVPSIWGVLTAADCFFMPSRYEGLPTALVEAASAALPVVASDIPEIRLLRPGDAWTLRPVDDVAAFAAALRTVKGQLDFYRRLAADSAEMIRRRHSIARCAQRYLAVYEEAMGTARAAAPA